MSESESGQERTEEPTQRREEQAREQGQIVRSRELGTAVIMLTGCIALLSFSGGMARGMQSIFLHSFQFGQRDAFDPQRMLAFFHVAISKAMGMSLPLLAALFVAGLIGPLMLGGWNLSFSALLPKWERLNPLSGLGRIFSTNALVELLKAVVKSVLFMIIAVVILRKYTPALLSLDALDLHIGIARALQLLQWGSLLLCMGFLLVVAIDVPYQLWSHHQKMRMTLQEVKDEMRDQEGKPEVKGRMRQLQREMSRSRMMSAVPNADVIITNPTHFAVALKYDMDKMDAPVVLAKGADILAFKIREIATQNRIEIVESPALARAIYFSTEVDRTIPPGLYLAVAQVLAYVYQLKQYRAGRAPKPHRQRDYNVPPEWRRSPEGKPE